MHLLTTVPGGGHQAEATELQPPSVRQRARELLTGRDMVRLALGSQRLRSLPRGDGGPVVVVPGYGCTDRALLPLRRFLQSLGHAVHGAGLGRVGDDVPAQYPRVAARCTELAASSRRQVAVVGWSIGGVLVREAARDLPDTISQVITFGTPVVGGPSYTALARRYDETYLAMVRAAIAERDEVPIQVPVAAIWSPNDGIVTPRACLDERTPDIEHHRVSSTHVGMSLDPDVWSIIAQRLASGGQISKSNSAAAS